MLVLSKIPKSKPGEPAYNQVLERNAESDTPAPHTESDSTLRS